MKIMSKSLKNFLELHFKKNIIDITDNDINTLDFVSLRYFKDDINSFEELKNFKKLNTICIDSYDVSSAELMLINQLNIKKITFNSCKLRDMYMMSFDNINELTLINCSVDDYGFLKNTSKLSVLKIINQNDDENIDISCLVNNKLNVLILDNTVTSNFKAIENINSIKYLSLLNTIIDIDEVKSINKLINLETIYIDDIYSSHITKENVVLKTNYIDELFMDIDEI